jgi:undecaprenyl-diphosphatase
MALSEIRERRHLEMAVILWVILIIAGIWVFAETADEVMEGDLQQFDEWVIRAMRQPDDPSVPIGGPVPLTIARDITALGGFTILILIILVVLGLLLLQRKRGAAGLVFFATALGMGLSQLLKNLFSRERPDMVPHLVPVSTASFPSGHAMLSAIVYLTLGVLLARFLYHRPLKIYVLTIAILLSLLIGLSRIYLGVHYPTDVLAGWSAGAAWALLCLLAARFLERRGAVGANKEKELEEGGRRENSLKGRSS